MQKFLIIGLGNPGYDNTIHNIGADIVKQHLQSISYIQKKNLYINKEIPMIYYTFNVSTMNISGEYIKTILKNNNIQNFIIIYDNIRVKAGKIKLSYAGESSGHNGIKSIINHCSNNFWRIHVGVGPKPSYMDLSDFVLSKITTIDLKKIRELEPLIWQNIYNTIFNFKIKKTY
jgi:peptidyl-tRNA hydrolase, PTH1 family